MPQRESTEFCPKLQDFPILYHDTQTGTTWIDNGSTVPKIPLGILQELGNVISSFSKQYFLNFGQVV